MQRSNTVVPVAVALCLMAAGSVASPVTWTDWISASVGPPDTASGVIGGTTVSYSGNFAFVQLDSGSIVTSEVSPGNLDYWTEGSPAPYTGNAVVDNRPPGFEMVALSVATTNSITFSQALYMPIMAVVSVGQPGLTVTYDFDTSFTVLSEGRGFFGDGTYTHDTVNDILTGNELHAVIQFDGFLTGITWTSTAENWHGFTFGVVPEPLTLLLLGAGLVLLPGARRRAG